MQLIESDLECETVHNKMTDSVMIQAVTDSETIDTITDVENSVKCNGNVDDSKDVKVVKNYIVTSHNEELYVDIKENGKAEQSELNTSEISQFNGIENNVQKKERYCKNNHSEPINEVSEVNQKDVREFDDENVIHNETIIQIYNSKVNFEQSITTTLDINTITELTTVNEEKVKDNTDCNDGIITQTEYIEHFNIKTTANIDTISESTLGGNEQENDNIHCIDDTIIQTDDIKLSNTNTNADIDTIEDSTSNYKENVNENPDLDVGITVKIDDVRQTNLTIANIGSTVSTLEGKEKGNEIPVLNDGVTIQTEDVIPHEEENNMVISDKDLIIDSEKNNMDDNNSNAHNVDNDATITDVIKDSNLEDNGNSNDTITADNQYLSIKQTGDDSEDNFDKDDMAALVYSNSESEDANDQVSSECESICNVEDKIVYENEGSGDSMEVTDTAISTSVTEAIARLTDSPNTTVLEDGSMEVTETAISGTMPEGDNDNPIVTVLQGDLIDVTDTAISSTVTEADSHSPITTILHDDSMEFMETAISESVTENQCDINDFKENLSGDSVQESKNTIVKTVHDIDANSMEIDNESSIVSKPSVPEHSGTLVVYNEILEGEDKLINAVNTAESIPLQEEADLNLETKPDKSAGTKNTNTEGELDLYKESDVNVDFNAREEDNNKPSGLENILDNNCILKASNVASSSNNENKSSEKGSLTQEPSDNKTNEVHLDEKIHHNAMEPSKEQELNDSEDLIPDSSTQVEKGIFMKTDSAKKPSINLEDDDDIMLIDDDSSSKECEKKDNSEKQEIGKQSEDIPSKDIGSECKSSNKISESDNNILMSILNSKDDDEKESLVKDDDKKPEDKEKGPLVMPNFVQSFKSDISDMTRVDLEEFCLLKIVEGLIDRSNLSEIKTKLKTMVQHVEEWRKRAMMLTKQNRDLQIVLKTVQEDQKKRTAGQITPLRITRSVGMQVFMNENVPAKRTKVQHAFQNKQHRPSSGQQQKPPKAISIPVPRLVPATNNSPLKSIKSPPPQVNNNVNIPIKQVTTPQAIARTIIPQNKVSEKRPHNNSVTVDLTDDEPPTKFPNNNKTPPQKFRLVPSQQLMHSPRMNTPTANTRKVYIPISGTQNQGLVPGQTIVFKSIPPPVSGARPRTPAPTRMATPTRVVSANILRHPAPLPEVGKQPRPMHWKPLPPSPELKISKVENGIVISWKIDGYQEDIYEKIASYQLFAYQETSAPPNTLHWKKIGDVKALALPMACTLTQFMAGYKYYFAVRAVDIRSRFGPFSLPGSILLMNKKTD